MHDGVGQALLTDEGDADSDVAVAGNRDDRSAPPEVARYERRAMGSPLRLTVVGLPAPRADLAWETVSATIEEVEQALSRFRETSDLVALNARAGDPDCAPAHPWLAAALVAADRAQRLTGGAFDPRILGDLERLGYPGAAVGGLEPDPGARRRTFPGGRWLRFDAREGRVAVAAPIDLGGIGKGLAIRWAIAAAERIAPEVAGPRCGALLEAGGDIVIRGRAPADDAWMIAIEDPAGREEPAIVALHGGAICTSSVQVHRWRAADGRDVHHILDPRTGEPGGAGLLAVTVAGPDPAWAEVWSKTLFLEGAAGIGPAARSRGLAAWWVREDGGFEMTPAGRELTAWVRDDS